MEALLSPTYWGSKDSPYVPVKAFRSWQNRSLEPFCAMKSVSHMKQKSSFINGKFLNVSVCSPNVNSLILRKAVPVRCTAEDAAIAQASINPVKASSKSDAYSYWNSTSEKLAASATLPFLLLQLPQFILNIQNLMAGNNTALFAIPWMGLLTGLLGNLSLLSYFAGKKEKGAMIVQAVGVLSTYMVLVQLAIAGAMPSTAFIATTVAVGLGYVVNFLNYNNMLSASLWKLWQDVISVGGVSVLPQVMWSTFQPYLPPSNVPGIAAFTGVLTLVTLERLGKLPKQMHKFMGGLAAWSATLLFMWGPVAQMWSNFLNPGNIRGLSVLTILLAMLGNGLLLPRALFTRDLMWFTGSSWGALLQGWGVLLSMWIFKCVSGPVFTGISCALALWLGNMLVQDSKAYSLSSPTTPLFELISGTKRE